MAEENVGNEKTNYNNAPVKLKKPGFIVGNVPKEPFKRRLKLLKLERQGFIEEAQSITDYIRPRRGRYLITDRNKPRSHANIINNTATIASRTLGSGMMGGVSSPARPWFRITTPDTDKNEFDAVKDYLAKVAQRMQIIFARSNIYNCLHTMYGDLGDFGNAACVIDEDFEDVIRATVFAPGEYYFACGSRGVVDTLYRENSHTVINMITRWGDACSQQVKNQYDQGNYDDWVEVVHVIEPNMQQITGVKGPLGAPYICAYFEAAGDNDKLLERKGYGDWPAPCPRWDVMAGDTYGGGCGLDARGDAKALQTLERRKAQGIDKVITPPVQRPTSLANDPVAHMPGGVTTTTESAARGAGIRPLYEIRAEGINAIAAEILRHEQRINKAYYADLFLMLSQSDRREITAREVEERHEEKLLALGPVLERLHDELLNVVINRTFNIMAKNSGPDPQNDGKWAGPLPEPPKELEGETLRIEYISILAQAQKAVSIGGIERVAGFVGSLASAYPEVIDKFDSDQAVDEYANNIGIAPKIIVSDELVQEKRQARAQQMKQAQQLEQVSKIAAAGKDAAAAGKVLSEARPDGTNLLGSMGIGSGPTQ